MFGKYIIFWSALILPAAANDLAKHVEALGAPDASADAILDFLTDHVDADWQFVAREVARGWFAEPRVEALPGPSGQEFYLVSFRGAFRTPSPDWLSDWKFLLHPPDHSPVYFVVDLEREIMDQFLGEPFGKKWWIRDAWERLESEEDVEVRGIEVAPPLGRTPLWSVIYPIGSKGVALEGRCSDPLRRVRSEKPAGTAPKVTLSFDEDGQAWLTPEDQPWLTLLGPEETLKDAITAGEFTVPKKERPTAEEALRFVEAAAEKKLPTRVRKFRTDFWR